MLLHMRGNPCIQGARCQASTQGCVTLPGEAVAGQVGVGDVKRASPVVVVVASSAVQCGMEHALEHLQHRLVDKRGKHFEDEADNGIWHHPLGCRQQATQHPQAAVVEQLPD